MTFPLPPLHLEERVELVTSSAHEDVVFEIQKRFAKRRNKEFPNWRAKYEASICIWLAWQQRPKKKRS